MSNLWSYIVLALLLCGVAVWADTPQQECSPLQWPEDLGSNPMAARRGKVVLVALLHAYCGFCILQAQRLESLKATLAGEGFPDVDMIVVNGGDVRSRTLAGHLTNATSLEVLQDTSDNVMYQQVFRGQKDDFIVYDRCSHAIVFLPYPYSNLDYPYTKMVLRRIHSGRHSCYCSLDYSQPQGNNGDGDVMMGDDPNAYQSASSLSSSASSPRDGQDRNRNTNSISNSNTGTDRFDCSGWLRPSLCQMLQRMYRQRQNIGGERGSGSLAGRRMRYFPRGGRGVNFNNSNRRTGGSRGFGSGSGRRNSTVGQSRARFPWSGQSRARLEAGNIRRRFGFDFGRGRGSRRQNPSAGRVGGRGLFRSWRNRQRPAATHNSRQQQTSLF